MAPSDGWRTTAGATAYLINHVVLPPKLPQEDDFDPVLEQCLLDLVLCSLRDLRDHVDDRKAKIDITAAIQSITYLDDSRDQDGNVSELQLRAALEKLMTASSDGKVPLEIKAQNAGLIITRGADHITFETFELSLLNKAAMGAVGRLVRTFPGSASSVPTSTMKEQGFLDSLAFTLAKMSTQIAPGFQPQVRKAGKMLDENRDTTDPALVTDWLMNYIAAFGGFTSTARISKNTREDVLWLNCLQPWRRSPLWLLVRVNLQLLFTQRQDTKRPIDDLYKGFMILLLSRLLSSAKEHRKVLGDESVYLIHAKLARRIRKLENIDPEVLLKTPWMTDIKANMIEAHASMKEDWIARTGCSLSSFTPQSLHAIQPANDLDMTMPELDANLAAIAARTRSATRAKFIPAEVYPTYPSDNIPSILDATGDYKYHRIAALEAWVEQHLEPWLSTHIQEEATCAQLRRLIELYHRNASVAYVGIPVGLSVMYLTLLELWVACDKSACHIHPSLESYDPEIDLSEFQCLLLPFESQMARLHEIECYLYSRRHSASSTNPSVFRDFGHPASFAVKYFDNSLHLQDVLSDIKRVASAKQKQKGEELAELKQRHKNLMDRYNSEPCETHQVVYNHYHGYTESIHKPSCTRCTCKTLADNLSIDIYEWPVSSHEPAAKATIFELLIPHTFSEWRDVSTFLKSNVLGYRSKESEQLVARYTLDQHRDLSHLLSAQYQGQRIVPLSEVKPNIVTHRKSKKGIPNLTNADVCLPNGLRYVYFDELVGAYTSISSPANDVATKCMYRMPNGRSKVLERFMCKFPGGADGMQPNEVIATQSECPAHFSVDEYKTFGSLPWGCNILYSNILVQLATPSIDFTKPETHTLVLQVIEQTGLASGSSSRINHSILEESTFGQVVLDQLVICLRRVAMNWESWRAVASFVALSRRVLTLTTCSKVRGRCLDFLDEARQISMKWLRHLESDAAASTDDSQRTELYSRATEIALLCSSTLDVDVDFIDAVLQRPAAISALVQCSMFVQDNHGSVQSESESLYKTMLQSWRSLLYRVFPQLRHYILRGSSDLHAAVLENWADFHPSVGTNWKILSKKHEHWLCIKSRSLSVYFDLLTGQLLVDGLPLARLPSEFMQHHMYLPLFGKSILAVAPTDRPGMKFSAKSTYQDYKLHFGMEGLDMFVVAIKNQYVLDLLPSASFKDRLPNAFIENYVHWYDHSRNEVIFRARKNPWSSTNSEWKLEQRGSMWRLVKGIDVLVNMASPTARILSKIFEPLESVQHTHITMDLATTTLNTHLPRLQIDFSLEHSETELRSRQYRGMIVDPDQAIGTLVGLASKLVLKSANAAHDRVVLIPVPRNFGTAAISHVMSKGQRHVTISVNRNNMHKVYAYSLDTTLGRVIGNGDMQQSLFLALLHALTSHCLPDPLTGHTGTESSLNILRSAAIRSFEFLAADVVDLLHQIAALSPLRRFYPANLREMQQVDWDSQLSSLSQHPEFRTCSEDIVRQARTMQLFYPDNMPDTGRWKSSESHLDARNMIRSSTFRVCGFGAEHFTSGKDVTHRARDKSMQSSRGQHAYIAATLVARDQPALHSAIPDLKGTLLQKHFKEDSVQGVSQSFDLKSLRFDSKWLGNSTDILKDSWCDIHRYLPVLSTSCNKYDIATWLSTMAFAESADMSILQAFAAFYRLQNMATLTLPPGKAFNLSDGSTFQNQEVEVLVRNARKSFDESSEAKLPKKVLETNKQHIDRLSALFLNRSDIAVRSFVADLKQQWPVAKPTAPTAIETHPYIDVSSATRKITARFKTWYRNRQFMTYLQQVSTLVGCQGTATVQVPSPVDNFSSTKHSGEYKTKHSEEDKKSMFGIDCIFAATPPALSHEPSHCVPEHALSQPCEPKLPINDQQEFSQSNHMARRLEELCASLLTMAQSKCEEGYVEQLRRSCASLKGLQTSIHTRPSLSSDDNLETLFGGYLEACKDYFERLNSTLMEAVSRNGSSSNEIGLEVQHSPRLAPTFWLSQLHRDRLSKLSLPWKAFMIKYGLAVTQLHRAQRLAAVSGKPADLMEELSHVGHSNWDPWDFPETLLLEAESGIMIRSEQEFIAAHMRNTEDAMNIVLQLLMGGGKSSVIVPMLAAFLADKEKLVRIIVAKPQSKQMLQMLVAKLGYLLNRRVYHMPFSRALRPSTEEAGLLRKIYEDCIQNRGVLLIQPEHILSFKLMAIEAALAGQPCAKSLLDTQKFFEEVSRDIVDESDENFSVKFELIYTMGTQRSIEFAPERWLVIQAIVGLVPRFARQIWDEWPQSIELRRDEKGRFPRIRVLNTDAAEALMMKVAEHIVEYGIVGLPTGSQPPEVQTALLRYITEPELTVKDIQAVEDSRFWTESTKSPLLLVRGLIAGGVLRFALSTKRWRVNFGLDASRVPETLLAVPFRSKDCSSPRSEFSHPDVVILLSLLSYYYGGLTDEQLFDSFAHLQKSDQADIHYNEWVDTASPALPTSFRQLSGVSLKNHRQCIVEVFPGLRYSRKAIDYYLSFLVFPKAMKEFPQKLSASGWDIGEIKAHPVTGFSGTNDTLHLLPLTVKHLDLPSQSHTNALVLQYLLQEETSVEPLPPRAGVSDAQHLLSVVIRMQPEVRVILDCGASILEQNNQQVAKTWLGMCNESIQAVVFFADEELSVLDRAGRTEPLQTSPFAKQIEVCLVYLDEAHTRGTDLKLPRNYRAAVTLGQGLVKDKLTQGCMRMRKLGVGQSVAFIVPEEISTKIRERTGKPSDTPIEVSDILCWSIGETWQDLKRSMPLWAVQGERYERNKNRLCGAATSVAQAEAFLEDEAQTLDARYRPRTQDTVGMEMLKGWDLENSNISKIVQRCQEFEAMGFGAATLSEEQERELAPEIEEERQIERPARLDAESHLIHPDVRKLALTGRLSVNSQAFRPAFQALSTTSAARLFALDQFPTDLLVTADFVRTVKRPTSSTQASFVSDSYQRPVQFILSVRKHKSHTIQNLVVISPVEANELLGSIRKNAKVTLHIFAPRANSNFAPLDKLELYNVGRAFSPEQVPRSLTVQLNLFTGSLYLRGFDEYTELCDFLGVLRAKPVEGQLVHADGFIDPPTGTWCLKSSPVLFLHTFLTKIRREGEGVEKTHVGKVLNGLRLEEKDFEADTEVSGT